MLGGTAPLSNTTHTIESHMPKFLLALLLAVVPSRMAAPSTASPFSTYAGG